MTLEILRSNGVAITNSYLVKLKDNADKEAHLEHMRTYIASLDGLSEVTHAEWDSEDFHGYAGKFSEASLEALLRNEDIEYIEEDSVETAQNVVTQENAPWGLARICQNDKLGGRESSLTFDYSYDARSGQGVDVYVLDSGIYMQHNQFAGRVSWGKTFIGTDKVDKNGHGTHVAGTIAATQYGVAKAANLIAVKVLDDAGAGSKTTSVDGMLWVKKKVKKSRPSIVNISTGGAYSKTQNDTIDKLTKAGIHVVVAAGNENQNADWLSPSSAPTAITVGATTFADARHPRSNFGSCVDVFAPGTNIISCGIADPNDVETESGTSMACPHVAGLVAYLISEDGNKKPDVMCKKIRDMSLKDKLTGIPTGTKNNLARNDIGIYTPA